MRTQFYPYLIIFLLILGNSCKKDDANSPDPMLNISRTNIEVGNDVGYTDTVVIQSNVNWSINLSAGASAWLSVDPVKKAGDSTVVTIKVTAANTASSQTGALTITPAGSNAQPIQVNITRKAYSLVWQKCYGGTSGDFCNSAALLPNDRFVTTGFSTSVDGDAVGNTGDLMGWALGIGNDGNKLWQKQVGGVGAAYQSVVASADGGSVIAGYGVNAVTGDYNFSVVKFDANGNIVWNKSYGGSNTDAANKIINTADGGYLVAGDTQSNDGDVANNHGNEDTWIVKLDANGNLVWKKTFGGAGNESLATVAACSDGGYILLSNTESNNTGDVPASHGQGDFFVVKMDANGNKIWSKTYGGSSYEYNTSVMGDTDGGCILLGYTTSTNGDVVGKPGTDTDLWVLKLNKDGQIGWQAALGGSGVDNGNSLTRLPDGHIVIGGSTNSKDRDITSNHGGADVWVLVMGNTGKVLWQKTFGSSSGDLNVDIAAAADGSLLVTNSTSGNDGDVSGNHGSSDFWIFKLK